MSEIASAYVSLMPSARGFGRAAESQIAPGATQAGKSAGIGLGTALTAGAAVGIAAVIKGAVGLEAQFSQTMNTIGAVANVPKAQLKSLSDLAIKMGADTVFSAKDASDAMLELAKGGISAANIQAGALQGTLTLAAAGGTDMATAATIASNAMNVFNLRGSKMDSVAAALAGGANASSASVESLGQALQQGGLAARTAGLSLQETVAALSAFDAAGLKGSDAGTSLKSMLNSLIPNSKKAIGAMDQLGLSFVKRNGDFQSLTNIAGQLQNKLGHLSQAERQHTLEVIFGSDGQRAATALMEEGRKGMMKYIAATNDKGAAERIAAARMKGTAGAIEQFKGSLETAQLQLGRFLAPATVAVLGALTAGLNNLVPTLQSVVSFIGQHQTAALALTGTIVALVAITKIHGAVLAVQAAGGMLAWLRGATLIQAVTRTWAAVQWLLNAALTANPIGIAVVALAALAAGLVYAYQHSSKFRTVVQTAFAAVKVVVGAVVGWLGKYVPQVFAAVATAVRTYVNAYKAVVTAAFNGIRVVVSAVMGFIGPFVRTQLAVAKAAFEAIKGVLSSAGQAFGKFASAVRDKIGEAISVIQSVVGKIKAAFSGAATMLYSAGSDIIRGLINGIKGMAGQAASAAVSVVKNALASAKGALGINSPSKKFAEVGMWSMVGLRKGIEDNADKPLKALAAMLQKIRDQIKTSIGQIKSDMSTLAGTISGAFTGNAFEATTGADMFKSGVATMSNLEALKRALKKLMAWNIDPKFLSALFASGNSALILDLASGPKWQAENNAGLFGTNQNLADQLGGRVADNQYGPKLDRLEKRLHDIEKAVKQVGREVGRELNGAVSDGRRKGNG